MKFVAPKYNVLINFFFFQEFYKASAVRNPVIDVAVMYGLSDIPDWCSVEGGYDFTSDSPLTLEKIDALAKKSPMFIADKIIAPTLLLLGKKDLRVPCSQGITLYNLLKSRNIKTRYKLEVLLGNLNY